MDVSQENNGFGPFVEKRSSRATHASLFTLVVSILCFMAISSENLPFCAFSFARSALTIFLGEIIIRLCLLAEEIKHKNSRYGGSLMAVLMATFSFNRGKMVAMCVIFILSTVFYFLRLFPVYVVNSQYTALFVLNIGALPLALYLIGLRELSPIEYSQLNERENKNVADGLAWSYYYGYLKLVLPHLEEQIKKSLNFRFKIKVPRVFILLPKNCFFPDKVSDADSRIKIAGPLPALKISRGGIYERSYKHTVYRIEMPNRDATEVEEHYCVAEYATPLKTLHDMLYDPVAALTMEERDQQCMVFIRKLREILDSDDNCRGKFVLIPMSGDENNTFDNHEGNKVADILVGHLTSPEM